jgi:hypothetical protein
MKRGHDGAYDAQPNLRLLQAEETLRPRLGSLGIGQDLAQMQRDQPAEIGETRQLALAPQQQTAEFLSSCCMARVSAGCETLQCSAARVKFKMSASARK